MLGENASLGQVAEQPFLRVLDDVLGQFVHAEPLQAEAFLARWLWGQPLYTDTVET